MAGNPFYIRPAQANIQPVLQGIGSLIKKNRAEALQKSNSEKLMNAYRSGKPDEVAKLMASNPELGKQAFDMLNFKNDDTKKGFNNMVRKIIKTPDPAEQEQVIINRINMVNKHGGNPVQSVQLLDQLQRFPVEFENDMLTLAAGALNPQEYDA